MTIQRMGVDHIDNRGVITDILRDTPIQHATLIQSKAGSVRGNHYHKDATVYVYVLHGSFQVYSREPKGKTTNERVESRALITFKPYDLHALVALEHSSFLLLSDGPRGGDWTIAETLYDPRT